MLKTDSRPSRKDLPMPTSLFVCPEYEITVFVLLRVPWISSQFILRSYLYSQIFQQFSKYKAILYATGHPPNLSMTHLFLFFHELISPCKTTFSEKLFQISQFKIQIEVNWVSQRYEATIYRFKLELSWIIIHLRQPCPNFDFHIERHRDIFSTAALALSWIFYHLLFF